MKYVTLNANIENYIKLLNNEDIANLIKAVFAYVNRNETLVLSENAQSVFDIIKKSLDNANRDATQNIDYESLKDMYNRICISLPACRNLSTKRKQVIKKAINAYGVEKLQECFQKAESSKFLTGKTSPWHADFDWLINETNIAKVLDGRYDKLIEMNKAARKNSSDFDNQRNYSQEDLNGIFGDTSDVNAFLEKLK